MSVFCPRFSKKSSNRTRSYSNTILYVSSATTYGSDHADMFFRLPCSLSHSWTIGLPLSEFLLYQLAFCLTKEKYPKPMLNNKKIATVDQASAFSIPINRSYTATIKPSSVVTNPPNTSARRVSEFVEFLPSQKNAAIPR